MNKKNELLGMPHGTARNRLVKTLLFQFVKETNNDICYRCGLKIEEEKDLSIEHKDSWQKAKNPYESFFDLKNIAYSHMSCNFSAANKGTMQQDCSKRKSAKPNCDCLYCKEIHKTNHNKWWNNLSLEERIAYRRK